MTATEPPVAGPIAAPTAARGRRIMLVVLSMVFTLWVAGLLTMYFMTVYPQRHPPARSHLPGMAADGGR